MYIYTEQVFEVKVKDILYRMGPAILETVRQHSRNQVPLSSGYGTYKTVKARLCRANMVYIRQSRP